MNLHGKQILGTDSGNVVMKRDSRKDVEDAVWWEVIDLCL